MTRGGGACDVQHRGQCDGSEFKKKVGQRGLGE